MCVCVCVNTPSPLHSHVTLTNILKRTIVSRFIHEYMYEILLVDNHKEFAQENPRKQRRFGDNNPKSVERS